jgi:hypothetical protein
LGILPWAGEKVNPGGLKYPASLPGNSHRWINASRLMMLDRRSTAMDDHQLWEFTCKTCGSHKLTVTRVWEILAGPDSETWQEWGPLEADHHWRFEFKEKIE